MPSMSLFAQIRRNKCLSAVIVLSFALFLLVVGSAIGWAFWDSWVGGAVFAAMLAAVYIPVTLASSTRLIMSVNGAREIKSEDEHPFLWHTVESLAIAARIPRPRLFIVETDAPNAFATGIRPEKAAVAVTRGLLERLSREEIEAVLAHEIAHIRNYDVRLATIAIAMVGVISILSDITARYLWLGGGNTHRDNNQGGHNGLILLFSLVLVVLSPIIATMIQLLLSRRREFLADAEGAKLCRNPEALASALEKISKLDIPIERVSQTSVPLYFVDPRKKKGISTFFRTLFATHPPVEERIKALRQMITKI